MMKNGTVGRPECRVWPELGNGSFGKVCRVGRAVFGKGGAWAKSPSYEKGGVCEFGRGELGLKARATVGGVCEFGRVNSGPKPELR